jgi:tetratricopeptide (TPR) repeat protein/energy-converting hydrogenase Eha subunit A
MRNRASLDKWLMAVALGALMVVAGLSSTDKGWAVIGAVILVVALLIAALEVYSWTRKSQGKSTELPTPVVVVICAIAAPVLGVWGFKTGDLEAVLVAFVLVVLLVLLFLLRNTGPIKIGEITTGDVRLPLSGADGGSSSPIKITIGDTEIPISQTETKFTLPLNIAMKATELPFFKKEGSYLRGILSAVKGDADSALEAFRVYGAEGGEAPELAAGRAIALLSDRRYDEALAELDRSLAAQPTGIVRLLRGQVLLTLGAVPEALADIEAAAQDGLVPGVKGMLGAAYLETGRLNEAIAALKEASTELIATSGTMFTLGEAYRRSGQEAAARGAYEDAAARAIVDSQFAVVSDRGVLPLALARQGKLDEAEIAVQQLTATSPADPSLQIARALIEVKRGTPGFAPSDLGDAISANPHTVVKALEDPDFAPLLADDAGRQLLERAKAAREIVLERVRGRNATV